MDRSRAKKPTLLVQSRAEGRFPMKTVAETLGRVALEPA